jgi:hypothetical protein
MKSQVNQDYHQKATVIVGNLKLNQVSRNINVKASTSEGNKTKYQNGKVRGNARSYLLNNNENALKEFRSSLCNIILK